MADAVSEAATGVPPIVLRLDQAGSFPAAGPPTVVWIAQRAESRPLLALADRVRAALARRAVPHDGKPFRPHVTLGRMLPRTTAADAYAVGRAAAGAIVDVPEARLDEVLVVESRLSPRGARHLPLRRVSLGDGLVRSIPDC